MRGPKIQAVRPRAQRVQIRRLGGRGHTSGMLHPTPVNLDLPAGIVDQGGNHRG